MAKHVQAAADLPLTPEQLRQRLLAPQDLERIALAAGALAATATVQGTTSIVRRTFSVPNAARAFLGSDMLEVVETRNWHDSDADVTVSVEGVALSAIGRVTLTDHDGASRATLECVVEAKMGFVGMFAEQMVAERLHAVFEAETAALA